jgi:site-specific DNA-methyltransferase (adenine-specific)
MKLNIENYINKHEKENSFVYQMDCMEFMKQIPDKYFDLAVVDPPYGIGFGKFNRTNKASNGERYKANKYKNSNWDDDIPSDEYFAELMRVSKNQIVWGANYFPCLWKNGCKGFVFWNKDVNFDSYSAGELAYTSFNKTAKYFYYAWNGLADGIRGRNKQQKTIHPTQKPIALYNWIFKNYAESGMKIFDSHLGSQSSRISAYHNKLIFYGTELDSEYFETANKRFEQNISQLNLF